MITDRLKKLLGREMTIDEKRGITVIMSQSSKLGHLYFTFWLNGYEHHMFPTSLVQADYDRWKHEIFMDIRLPSSVSEFDLDRMIRFLGIMVQNADDNPKKVVIKSYYMFAGKFDKNGPGIKRFKHKKRLPEQ